MSPSFHIYFSIPKDVLGGSIHSLVEHMKRYLQRATRVAPAPPVEEIEESTDDDLPSPRGDKYPLRFMTPDERELDTIEEGPDERFDMTMRRNELPFFPVVYPFHDTRSTVYDDDDESPRDDDDDDWGVHDHDGDVSPRRSAYDNYNDNDDFIPIDLKFDVPQGLSPHEMQDWVDWVSNEYGLYLTKLRDAVVPPIP